MDSLKVDVSDLLHHPGSHRSVHVEAMLLDLSSGPVTVQEEDPLVLDAILERVSEGIVVRGEVQGQWHAVCSRCLTDVERPLTVQFSELFEEHPKDDETYPLSGESIDLELPLRDAVILDLPPVPLCSQDCVGLCSQCGVDRNVTDCGHTQTIKEHRWEALKDLKLN